MSNPKVTKETIVQNLCVRLGLSTKEASDSVDLILELVENAFRKEGSFVLKNICTIRCTLKPGGETMLLGKQVVREPWYKLKCTKARNFEYVAPEPRKRLKK